MEASSRIELLLQLARGFVQPGYSLNSGPSRSFLKGLRCTEAVSVFLDQQDPRAAELVVLYIAHALMHAGACEISLELSTPPPTRMPRALAPLVMAIVAVHRPHAVHQALTKPAVWALTGLTQRADLLAMLLKTFHVLTQQTAHTPNTRLTAAAWAIIVEYITIVCGGDMCGHPSFSVEILEAPPLAETDLTHVIECASIGLPLAQAATVARFAFDSVATTAVRVFPDANPDALEQHLYGFARKFGGREHTARVVTAASTYIPEAVVRALCAVADVTAGTTIT